MMIRPETIVIKGVEVAVDPELENEIASNPAVGPTV
jgi:hypothetical protein